MSEQHRYLYYGSRCNALDTRRFLLHTFQVNDAAEALGKRKTPVCIWGHHGIGKTELVQDLAAENGWAFAYVAPAQFEEMGDLVGMPRVSEKDGAFTTKLAPPDWVPQTDGPGILLLDDVNRADDRILRGIMQLLQNFELVSWKLPRRWQIVLTANPDGGDYSVTPMDNAMLTRMYHVTMDVDVKAWALWAEKNGVDPRGIGFVLLYPEVLAGERTTPRSLVQFFKGIAVIEAPEKELDLVKTVGEACLDPQTVGAFLAYLDQRLHQIPSPEEILNTKKFAALEKQIAQQVDGRVKRTDILSVLCTRLANFILVNKPDLRGARADNLASFLLMSLLPSDLRLNTVQVLVESQQPGVTVLLSRPEIAQVILGKM